MTVIALFPPGVHDIEVESLDSGASVVRCTGCDWLVVALTGAPDEIRWAKRAGYGHTAKHRVGPCHAECVDEPGCLYDGDEG